MERGENLELQEQILEETLKIFNKKGLKFTMDDIARNLGISKKTIYTVFRTKEQLFLTMVDYIFDGIKISEQQVMDNEKLTVVEKIRKIFKVMPETYSEIDFRQLYQLKEKYPKIYKKVEKRLETGWENTITLLEQGMKQGVIRKIHIPIVKMMLESTLEQFFQRDILVKNQISYQEALDEVVYILMEGIVIV
jgi:response regulator of citrate/malate metabolism